MNLSPLVMPSLMEELQLGYCFSYPLEGLLDVLEGVGIRETQEALAILPEGCA